MRLKETGRQTEAKRRWVGCVRDADILFQFDFSREYSIHAFETSKFRCQGKTSLLALPFFFFLSLSLYPVPRWNTRLLKFGNRFVCLLLSYISLSMPLFTFTYAAHVGDIRNVRKNWFFLSIFFSTISIISTPTLQHKSNINQYSHIFSTLFGSSLKSCLS